MNKKENLKGQMIVKILEVNSKIFEKDAMIGEIK